MSASHGGRRPGAGRKAGGRNKATIEREVRAAHGVETALLQGLMPLDIMLARMRNQQLPNGQQPTDAQFQAATAAAPYLHPRLSAVAFQKPPSRSKIDVSVLTSDERKMLLAAIRRGLIRQTDDGGRQLEGEVADD